MTTISGAVGLFLKLAPNGRVYVEAGSYGLHIHVVMGSLFAVAFKK